MRRFISTVVILAIVTGGFFLFGGDVSIENGLPQLTFSGSWEHAGATIGNAAGNLLDGFFSGIMGSDTIKEFWPTTPTLTQPTVIAPEIPEGSDFQIHFIDVGQADCALIICDGKAMLIDGGNDADGNDVVAYLHQQQVESLNLVVGTHSHEDHIGGLDYVLNAFPTVEVWFPDYRSSTVNEKMFLEAAAKQGANVYQPSPGTTYTLGSAICQVLGPLSLDPEEPNNHSIVIKITYGETSFLFTGDMEFAAETEILDAGYDIKCDVLKVAHHGSSSSTKYRWVRAAAPAYAVISVGADNDYGHPTEACLSILEDAEIKVYRTDLQGHIVCISDGKTVSFISGR